MAVEVEVLGCDFRVELISGAVTIYRAGVWAGRGWWDGRIVDCAAVFGTTDETECVYEALDGALAEVAL